MSTITRLLLGFSLIFSFFPLHMNAQGQTKDECRKILNLNYQDSVKAFEKIRKGMGQLEVCSLLGTPDRAHGKDPDQTWYDESWTYDFKKHAGFPKTDIRKADWEGDVMFLHRKVVHTRKIGWLE